MDILGNKKLFFSLLLFFLPVGIAAKKKKISQAELMPYAYFEKVLDPEPFQFSPSGKRVRSFGALVLAAFSGGLCATGGAQLLEWVMQWREAAVINYRWRLFDQQVRQIEPLSNCLESGAELFNNVQLSAGQQGISASIGSLSLPAATVSHQEVGRSEIDAVDHIYWVTEVVVFLVVTLITYRLIKRYWNDTDYLFCAILSHLIDHWQEHKQFIPEEFHEHIEELVARAEAGDDSFLCDEDIAQRTIIAWVLRCLEVRTA